MATEQVLQQIQSALSNGGTALRANLKLTPAGGDGDKVFPPTYEGGQYATEQRLINGERVETVLLDSVQSQANRIEQALLSAHRQGAHPDSRAGGGLRRLRSCHQPRCAAPHL